MRYFDKPPNPRAFLLRFTFSLPRQGLTEVERAALCAPDYDARAAPPEVRGARPVVLHKIQRGEVVEVCADGGVVGAQRRLVDRQRAPVERLGLAVAALRPIQHGEAAEPD